MRKYPHTTAEPEGRGGKGTRTLAMLMLGPKPVKPILSLGSLCLRKKTEKLFHPN
jgi:hypothetical protein